MENCIFCKIIKGEIPCSKIWENENYFAFLDIFPNTKGMTIVIPKAHHPSDITAMNDADLSEFISSAKKVMTLLKKSLGVSKVAIVAEGEGVNHAHFKLYPMHGNLTKHATIPDEDHKFFDQYPGYITTLGGPKATPEELNSLAHEIRKKFGLE